MHQSGFTALAVDLVHWLACSGLAPGSALPAVRELAKRHHVSIAVVVRALALLERDGWVERRHGRGVFVRQLPPLTAGGHSSVLFLIVGVEADAPYSLRLAEGAQRIARTSGAGLSYHRIDAGQDLGRWLDDHRADGAIIAGRVESAMVDAVARRLPVVLAGSVIAERQPGTISWVMHDDQEAAYLAIQHLLALGHHHIAYIAGDPQSVFIRAHLAGIAMALSDGNRPPQTVRCIHPRISGSEQIAEAGLAVAMGGKHRPTAILCCDWSMVATIVRRLDQPDAAQHAPLSLLSLSDRTPDELGQPITAFPGDPAAMGEMSMTLLLELLAGKPVRQVLLPRRFIRRGSTRPAPARP